MKTNQVLLLVLPLTLSLLWPSTALPFTPGNTGKLPPTSEGDGKILQRSKRGWMWNQFFLLEEYTGNDHQYVGKVKPRFTVTWFQTAVIGWIVVNRCEWMTGVNDDILTPVFSEEIRIFKR